MTSADAHTRWRVGVAAAHERMVASVDIDERVPAGREDAPWWAGRRRVIAMGCRHAVSVILVGVLGLAGCSQSPPEKAGGEPPADETSPEPTEPRPEGTWQALPDAPIATRFNHTATWAGEQLIIWGGQDQDSRRITADGAAWDPARRRWRRLPAAPVEPRWGHEAVWTGDELLVWGGTAGPDHLAECYTDGARYDPASDTWETIPQAPGPSRCGATAVWTGDELIAFGGYSGPGPPGPGDRHDDGVAYDPDTGRWRALPAAPMSPRAGGVAAWTGERMVVYGGHAQAGQGETGFVYRADGAAYHLETDSWRELAESPLPALRGLHGLSVDGELMVFGGQHPDTGEHATAAAAYDPDTDRWRTLADMPGAHETLRAAAADGVIHVVGRGLPDRRSDDAAAEPQAPTFMTYLAETDRWSRRADPPGGPRSHHALAWTGDELVVWGGQTENDQAPVGLRWQPPD